jgi:hypothetical protein
MAWAVIAGAYIAVVCVSFALRRRRSGPAVRVASVAPYVAISLPLLLLVTAVLVEGPSWSDWHFWQLYLIGATIIVGCYITAILACRVVTAIKQGRTLKVLFRRSPKQDSC